jgi:hypothetical protein
MQGNLFLLFITQTIQRIYLKDNGIGEVGALYISEAIKSNKVIVYLFSVFVQFTLAYLPSEGTYCI